MAACLVLGISSCNDELDIDQHGVIDKSSFYQTDNEAVEAVTAAYVDIMPLESFAQAVKNMLADDFWAGVDIIGEQYWQLNNFTFDANHPDVNNLFNGIYTVIAKCNTVLENVGESTAMQQRCRAEAKVIRAWMYFELTSLWGNPPLVDHVLGSNELAQPNADTETLWAFIINDLNEAIASGALMEKTSADDNTVYHVTKQYAQALLGKAYLWSGDKQHAAEAFDAVINSGKYRLFDGDFGNINSVHSENNCESMFESNVIIDEENPNNALRLFPIIIGLSGSQWNFGANVLGYNISGFGGFVPRKALYDAFVAEEGANSYRLTRTMKTYDELQQAGYSLMSGQRISSEGLFRWKTRVELDAVGIASIYDNGNNIRWMRYAEVLLLAAEANVGLNQAKANDYLNQVRQRAHLPYKEATLDAVKLEKRLELCGESVRFQDLVRWGDAATVLKEQGKVQPQMNANGTVEYESRSTDYGFKTGKHERLPYPASELLVNKNLKQNPNY